MLGRISIQAFNFDQIFQSYMKDDFTLVSSALVILFTAVLFH